jgi:hypothetical protein
LKAYPELQEQQKWLLSIVPQRSYGTGPFTVMKLLKAMLYLLVQCYCKLLMSISPHKIWVLQKYLIPCTPSIAESCNNEAVIRRHVRIESHIIVHCLQFMMLQTCLDSRARLGLLGRFQMAQQCHIIKTLYMFGTHTSPHTLWTWLSEVMWLPSVVKILGLIPHEFSTYF